MNKEEKVEFKEEIPEEMHDILINEILSLIKDSKDQKENLSEHEKFLEMEKHLAEGVCNGLSHMMALTRVAGLEIKHFQTCMNRMQWINANQGKIITILYSAKEAIKQKQPYDLLSPDQKNSLETLAFFEGIILFQMLDINNYYQRFTFGHDFFAPVASAATEGIEFLSMSFDDQNYYYGKLKLSLQILTNELIDKKITIPILLTFCNYEHSINIVSEFSHPDKISWRFLGANQPWEWNVLSDEAKTAEKIFKEFAKYQKEKIILFENIEIIFRSDLALLMEVCIQEWNKKIVENELIHRSFHTAVTEGDQKQVIKLLEAGVDADYLDEYNITPMEKAIHNNHPEIVKALLKKTVLRADSVNLLGASLLHLAAKLDCWQILEIFLADKSVNPDVMNKHKVSPLDLAIQNKQKASIMVLLDKISIDFSRIPLNHLIEDKQSAFFIKVLFEKYHESNKIKLNIPKLFKAIRKNPQQEVIEIVLDSKNKQINDAWRYYATDKKHYMKFTSMVWQNEVNFLKLMNKFVPHLRNFTILASLLDVVLALEEQKQWLKNTKSSNYNTCWAFFWLLIKTQIKQINNSIIKSEVITQPHYKILINALGIKRKSPSFSIFAASQKTKLKVVIEDLKATEKIKYGFGE